MGPNKAMESGTAWRLEFQSSVRINVGPNKIIETRIKPNGGFQSSVRINVGPNSLIKDQTLYVGSVSILRED